MKMKNVPKNYFLYKMIKDDYSQVFILGVFILRAGVHQISPWIVIIYYACFYLARGTFYNCLRANFQLVGFPGHVPPIRNYLLRVFKFGGASLWNRPAKFQFSEFKSLTVFI